MIILTGASGGIGREIATSLCQIDQVLGVYNSSRPEPLENSRLTYEKVDLADESAIKKFIEKWTLNLSKITIIHNASSKVDALAVHTELSDWDYTMGVNLRANFLLTQALLPIMIKDGWGRIVHISSKGGMEGAPGTVAYSASKTGLIGMSRVLAKEYARFNITSNILALGAFETGMYLELSDKIKEDILNRIPSGSPGEVSNIVNAIHFLIKSEYVNGSVINVDGGA